MANKRFPIGFHFGPGGNRTGIKENFLLPLDQAGIAWFIMSGDDYPGDAAEIAANSSVPHTVCFRFTGAGKGQEVGYNFDVPNYFLSPEEAADEHYDMTIKYLPPEFDKANVWLANINEVDKNRFDWLGRFCSRWADRAMADNIKSTHLNMSSGEPEKNQWNEPGMQSFLRKAAANPGKIAIGLHEYSFTISNIKNQYPYLIGRFFQLHEVTDAMGIPRPTIMITEWGWEYQTVPDVSKALADIDLIAQLYVKEPNIRGAAIWYLGPGFGGIADKAQKLIKPVGDMALNWQHYVDVGDPDPPPTDPNCIATDENVRTHILRPRSLTEAQWKYIENLMINGVQLPDVGHVIIGYEGWTHTDAMDAIKEAVAKGYIKSRLVIVDGHFIGTGLDQAWMEANCPYLVPYTVWLRSDGGQTGPFEFKVWPSDYKYVTQFWGNNPAGYAPYGLPGHDGVDIRAPEGTPIYAVADGTAYRVETDENASNYGLHVRLQHQDGYKTIYGHASRIVDSMYVGKQVKAGDIIMYSGNTGNSFGAHLHMGLKRTGYTYTDSHGTWPYNLFDPTPYLQKLCSSCFSTSPPLPAAGSARLGLHASADPGLAAGESDMFVRARIDLAKIMSVYPEEHVSQLASKLAGKPFVIRAFLSFHNRPAVTAQQFFDWTINDVGRYMKYLQGRDVFIELHNEPNLTTEGLAQSWSNGATFAGWLLEVIRMYRQAIPSAKLVFPGLSPGGDVGGLREDSMRFVQEARAAVDACDVLGVHAYWAANWPMSLALQTVDGYRSAFPGKTIIVTEASNNRGDTPQAAKGSEYIEFWKQLKNRPEIYGVTYFVASASNQAWNWGSGTGEVWLGTSIPDIVGAR